MVLIRRVDRVDYRHFALLYARSEGRNARVINQDEKKRRKISSGVFNSVLLATIN